MHFQTILVTLAAISLSVVNSAPVLSNAFLSVVSPAPVGQTPAPELKLTNIPIGEIKDSAAAAWRKCCRFLQLSEEIERDHVPVRPPTAAKSVPKERVAEKVDKRFPLSSNELKPKISDDVPKRLYHQGDDLKKCDICYKEMDQAREKLLKCQGEGCGTAIHKSCLEGWNPTKPETEFMFYNCPFCSGGRWKLGKYRHWCGIEENIN
jgi:hypothetical protein